MPKVVDHEQRRREIAEAVSRIAGDRGLQSVTFRQVATEAGMSVSLVQHYFGSKENLLIETLEIQSSRYADVVAARIAELDPDDGPVKRLRTIVGSFIPTDEESRAAMLLYHAFAGAALADPKLRRADAFRNGEGLRAAIAGELVRAQESGEHRSDFDPSIESSAILSLVLGLSLAILLDQTKTEEALTVLDAHLNRLRAQGNQARS